MKPKTSIDPIWDMSPLGTSCQYLCLVEECLRQLSQLLGQSTTDERLQQQKFVSQSSGDWKFAIWVPGWSDSGDSPLFQVADCQFCGGNRERAFWGPLRRPLIPFMSIPPSRPNYLQRSHLLTSSFWTLGFQHLIWGWRGSSSESLQKVDLEPY